MTGPLLMSISRPGPLGLKCALKLVVNIMVMIGVLGLSLLSRATLFIARFVSFDRDGSYISSYGTPLDLMMNRLLVLALVLL